MTTLTPLADTVRNAVPELTETQRTTLTNALTAREDAMADMFRMAGIQFGLYPAIVAEVFAEVGIGTPVTEEVRAMIRAQFVALMEEIQRQHGEH